MCLHEPVVIVPLEDLESGTAEMSNSPDPGMGSGCSGVSCGTIVVELRGFEPLTFSLRTRRATNCATAPRASRRDAKIHEPPEARRIGSMNFHSCEWDFIGG